jgi:hypothetical protein
MLGIKKAFIQASLTTKMPLDETAFAVWYGCWALGIESTLYTSTKDIQGELAKNTFVYAGIPLTVAALNCLEVPIPEILDYPTSLENFLGRWINTSTLGALRQRKTSQPIFVKPRGGTKLFNGFIYTGSINNLLNVNTFWDESPTWESEVVNFISEYRVLVHRGSILACRHYKGDCTVFPDMDVAKAMISKFKEAPCGYSLDLGITDMGKTLLVEVNDAWALGCYGTPSIPYTEMVINRWKEIVGI